MGNGDLAFGIGFEFIGEGASGSEEEVGFWDVALNELKSFGTFAINAPGVVLESTGNFLASFEGEANTLATSMGHYGKGFKAGSIGLGIFGRSMSAFGKGAQIEKSVGLNRVDAIRKQFNIGNCPVHPSKSMIPTFWGGF